MAKSDRVHIEMRAGRLAVLFADDEVLTAYTAPARGRVPGTTICGTCKPEALVAFAAAILRRYQPAQPS